MRRRLLLLRLLLFLVALPLVKAFLLPQQGAAVAKRHSWLPKLHIQSPLYATQPDNSPVQAASTANAQNATATTTTATTKDNDDQSNRDKDNSSLIAARVLERADVISQINNPADTEASPVTTRRIVLASALVGAAGLAATHPWSSDSGSPTTAAQNTASTSLPWEVTPVNKRTGVTVYDAEAAGYNLRFVTYLSRFLLNFDADCQRWWYSRAADLPRLASADEITQRRLAQFAAFAASVEVGLQDYAGKDGPTQLLQSLRQRYTEQAPNQQLTGAALEKRQGEIQEAQRQIALLFGLMEQNQPTAALSQLLAAIDNGSVGKIEIVDPGSGYAPGYGSPAVVFPAPDAGDDDYERATGRAILEPNGRLLRIDVVNRGTGYKSPPEVTIAPPAAIRFRDSDDDNTVEAEQAQAKAFIFRSGPNKGRIERIQLTNPGAGYNPNEIIKVRITSNAGGTSATARAVLEYQVAGIEMTNNGTGYAVERPLDVYVEPPPLTARVNMNDPIMVARYTDPNLQELSNEANRAACVGRGCYDRPVVAKAYPVAKKDSYNNFLDQNDTSTAFSFERSLVADEGRVVSATLGRPVELPSLGVASPISSSAQLLQLLPAGVGLEYNDKLKRYIMAFEPTYDDQGAITSWKSYKDFDPYFGPRGRTPIEKDMDLGVSTYLRFVASGAICCSVVHLALTPIDVVKTKVQTDPENYPGVISGFQRVLKEGGLSSFFTGWAPTFLGYFCWGGVAYSITELLRRTFQGYAGPAASSLEVPIILAAAGLAAVVGSSVICPFEAVRIRSVAQPDYGSNILDVSRRMVHEEGVGTLFTAVPVFMVKEVPFAMAKFTVFDLSTAWMYETFPAAREDLQLSLLVSLIGGTFGGIVAAVVSNPADATISEMKKSKNDMNPVVAAQLVIEKGGIPGLFRGLPLRLVFYSLMVSMQFLIYDAIRFALGVGSDDLVLYLDVLGGALQETGGPA